jgi:5'-nucleotidase
MKALGDLMAKLFERILLTNDDGIHSEGLNALRRAAESVCDEVWVVAPEHDQSGASACISLHAPLRMRKVEERVHTVVGTPCDSVIMALKYVLKDLAPDLVMSGINRGINLADDLLFSGTTNAALTAAFLGVRGVAFSQAYRNREDVKFQTGEAWVPRVLERLTTSGWNPGQCFNVNFPDTSSETVSEIEFVRQGSGSVLTVEVDSRLDMRQKPYFWFGFTRDRIGHEEDTDVAAVRRGSVAITPMQLDRTNYEILDRFRAQM